MSYAAAALRGAAAGVAGAGAMAATARVEQLFTSRPSSYVPAHTLSHLLGLPDPDGDRVLRNIAMHYGTGATVGALRGVWSRANLRGPLAASLFVGVRLSTDQTLENATGVGAPPWTWPRWELAVDVAHKLVYALATGAIADALVEPAAGSSARRRFLGRRLEGLA